MVAPGPYALLHPPLDFGVLRFGKLREQVGDELWSCFLTEAEEFPEALRRRYARVRAGGIEDAMEPALGLFQPLIDRQVHGHDQRRVKEHPPVVDRARPGTPHTPLIPPQLSHN